MQTEDAESSCRDRGLSGAPRTTRSELASFVRMADRFGVGRGPFGRLVVGCVRSLVVRDGLVIGRRGIRPNLAAGHGCWGWSSY